MKLEFSQQILGKQISNFMKIYWVGAQLYCGDGWMEGQADIQKWQS